MYLDVAADPAQSNPGAQPGDRPACHDNLEHLAASERYLCNRLGAAIASTN
jgi:hypothetical protein